MAPEIPEYVVAYAAGIYQGSKVDWPAVAGLVLALGWGQHRPDELAAAARTWVQKRVAPEAQALLERRAHRPWRRATIDTIELPKRAPKPPPAPRRRGPHRR